MHSPVHYILLRCHVIVIRQFIIDAMTKIFILRYSIDCSVIYLKFRYMHIFQ